MLQIVKIRQSRSFNDVIQGLAEYAIPSLPYDLERTREIEEDDPGPVPAAGGSWS